MRIFITKAFIKFCKKEKILDKALIQSVKNANEGLIDANLKEILIKQRIARKNEGKSGGYRTIIAFRKEDKSSFLYGFAKNEKENITDEEMDGYLKYGKILFALSDDQLEYAISQNELKEIKNE